MHVLMGGEAFFVRNTEAAVGIVQQKVAPEGNGGKVVDATGSVRDIAKDDRVNTAKALDDVDNRACVHQQPLGELQGHTLAPLLAKTPYRLVDFKVVVGGELNRVHLSVAKMSCTTHQLNGLVQVLVVEDIIWHLIDHERRRRRSGPFRHHSILDLPSCASRRRGSRSSSAHKPLWSHAVLPGGKKYIIHCVALGHCFNHCCACE